MEDSRKAITQMMDVIKKMFTDEENKLDVKKAGIPADIQYKRNGYAKLRLEVEDRKRKEAETKAAKQKERVDMIARYNAALTNNLLGILSSKKTAITNSFNAITLDVFAQKEAGLQKMSCDFPMEKFTELASTFTPFYGIRINVEEATAIRDETIAAYDIAAFANTYRQQITELKQSLIDRLPAKKAELDAVAEQERIAEQNRLAAEKAQREAAEAKSAAAKKRAEEESIRLAAEQKRIAEEQARLAEEKRLREAREAQELAEQKLAAEKEAEAKAEMERAAGTAATLFDQVAETAVTSASPEVRSGYEIRVKHSAGWIELITFWYQREGVSLSLDELEKKTFKQIKTFAENVAKKSDEKIESKYLVYETAIKSVNRKAK